MITNLLTSVNKELEELNHQLKDNDYLYDLEERIKIINESINKTHQENKELNKELERLNNIINELEKWLKEEYEGTIFDYHNAIEDVLDKLQELKGSDKVE